MKSKLEEEVRRFGNGGDGSFDWMNPMYAARDDQELKFMTAYFREPSFSRLPLLGICYCMQMMAAVQGIPMYIDITHNLALPPRRKIDSISFMSDRTGPLCAVSFLAHKHFKQSKNHHQSVNLHFFEEHPELYPGDSIDATSSDSQGKILDILSFKNRPAVGIQFHTETSSPRVSTAVFGWCLKELGNTGAAAPCIKKLTKTSSVYCEFATECTLAQSC
jgi:gamma-glutamyl-gamma-aminobutyrate hydrolase PuuD